jgi:hypothetical protein
MARIFTVQYKYMNITKYGRKQKIQTKTRMNILPGKEPGPPSL